MSQRDFVHQCRELLKTQFSFQAAYFPPSEDHEFQPPFHLNSCSFSQESYIICHIVVFNTVCTWYKKILDSAFDSIYYLIPPAYIVSLISVFIKIFKGTYMTIMHRTKWDSCNNIIIIHV